MGFDMGFSVFVFWIVGWEVVICFFGVIFVFLFFFHGPW